MYLYRIEASISSRQTPIDSENTYQITLEIEVPKEINPSDTYFFQHVVSFLEDKQSLICNFYDCGILNSLIKYYSKKNLHSFEVISSYRILREGEVSASQMSGKDKSKIEKLLNLSMSGNPHEAKVAMDMAIKLMKKNSLTREDIEQQSIIGVDVFPKNKMFSSWEIDLYSELGRVSGCYVLFYNRRDKTIRNRIMISGYERDVLNLKYVAQCYVYEIEKMTSARKISVSLDRKGITDYRNGLVHGVLEKITTESSDFFSSQPTGMDIVLIDDRIDEISSFLKTKSTRHNSPETRYSEDTIQGLQDSKKIHISKATEDKNSSMKRISQKDTENAQ